MTKVFLQNAWSPVYAGGRWPRQSWLRALARSRSGQRLRLLIDDFQACENTTPEVAAMVSGVCPPNIEHIKTILAGQVSLIICCGRQAETAVAPLWMGPLISVPHPACRVLTDELYRLAKSLIANGHTKRTRLIQRKGSVGIEPL